MLGLSGHHADRPIEDLIDRTLAAASITAAPVERYRALALALERVEPRQQSRVMVVTSALPGEGKTLTVTNLAYTLSGSFRRRVLLVDADLRRPRLHGMLAPHGTPASSLPAQDVPPAAQALGLEFTYVTPTLSTVASPAPRADDAVKTLNSPDMVALIAWARERFDWVLLDSPPVALVPDAIILSHLADAVLFVVLTGQTPWEVAKRAIVNIGRERVLGVVMNQVPPHTGDGGQYYYDAYEARNTSVASAR